MPGLPVYGTLIVLDTQFSNSAASGGFKQKNNGQTELNMLDSYSFTWTNIIY